MNRTTAIRLVEDWLLLLADTRDSNADTFIVWRDQETAIQQLLTAYKGMVVPITNGESCLFCGQTSHVHTEPEPAPPTLRTTHCQACGYPLKPYDRSNTSTWRDDNFCSARCKRSGRSGAEPRLISSGTRYILVTKDVATDKLLRNSFTSSVARDAWIAGTSTWAEVISIYEEDQEPCPPTK